ASVPSSSEYPKTPIASSRAAHQAPETDGQTLLRTDGEPEVGRMVEAKVIATEGVDLVAEPLEPLERQGGGASTGEADR
ncbi:30S ribosomal protein S12 methylthiotransferase RimO, partial [Streptomyces asiaticus]